MGSEKSKEQQNPHPKEDQQRDPDEWGSTTGVLDHAFSAEDTKELNQIIDR